LRTSMVPFDRLLPAYAAGFGSGRVAVGAGQNRSRWISVTPTAKNGRSVTERMIGPWSTCCVTRWTMVSKFRKQRGEASGGKPEEVHFPH